MLLFFVMVATGYLLGFPLVSVLRVTRRPARPFNVLGSCLAYYAVLLTVAPNLQHSLPLDTAVALLSAWSIALLYLALLFALDEIGGLTESRLGLKIYSAEFAVVTTALALIRYAPQIL
ncbi:MAG: hypothetical protein IT290_06395 [Deltaproteobacteria bacterium]|nr:hypothetical protein [Deltaproteobacteria bacterium]